MSLSLIAWNPRIDEPSNPTPSANTASVSSLSGSEKCCQVPGRSVNRTSTICTPASFALRITSAGVGAVPAFAALALMVGSNVAVMGSLSPQGLSLRRTHAPYHKQRPPVLALERRVVRGVGCGQETSSMRESTRAATECQAFRALPAAKNPLQHG